MRVNRMVGAVTALVLVVASCTSSSDTPPPDTSTTTTSTAATTTSTRYIPTTTTTTVDPLVAEIEAAVVLAVDSPEVAVAPGVLDGIDLEAGLPDGAVVTPVEGAVAVEDDVAEVLVDVTLLDGTTDQFVVVLVNVGSQWLVAYTVKLS